MLEVKGIAEPKVNSAQLKIDEDLKRTLETVEFESWKREGREWNQYDTRDESVGSACWKASLFVGNGVGGQ